MLTGYITIIYANVTRIKNHYYSHVSRYRDFMREVASYCKLGHFGTRCIMTLKNAVMISAELFVLQNLT